MAFMYCQKCKGVTEMKAVGARKQPQKEKRLYYRRERTCQSCSTTTETVEVQKSLITELDELKAIFRAIRDLANSHENSPAMKSNINKLKSLKSSGLQRLKSNIALGTQE